MKKRKAVLSFIVACATTLSMAVTPVSAAAEAVGNQSNANAVTYTAEANTKLKVPTTTLEAASATSITINWTKLDKANGYKLWKKNDAGKWVKLKIFTSKNRVSYTDTDLTPGKTYTYSVQGFMTVNGSRVWGSRSTTGVSLKLKLEAPESITAKPSSSSIKVKWDAVDGAEGYQLWKKTGTGSWKKVKYLKKTSYTDKDVVSGKTYTYRVRAYVLDDNDKKIYSAYAKCDAVIAGIALAKPTLTGVLNANGTASLLSWNKIANATGYVIYRSTDNGTFKKIKTISDAATVTYTDSSVKTGTTYYYYIQAYAKPDSGSTAYSEKSNTVTCKPNGIPSSHSFQMANICQYNELPTGCEISALAMVFNFYGFKITQLEVANANNYYIEYDNSTGNFVTKFYGDPTNAYGHGMYAPGLCASANRFFTKQGSGHEAVEITGTKLEDLYQYTAQDKPVWIYITKRNSSNVYPDPVANGEKYTYKDKTYNWYNYEHCVVLCGYNKTSGQILINDSHTGRLEWVNAASVNRVYEKMGCMAVLCN